MSEERTHAIKVGDILFRLALRILPAEFRTEYGSEIYAFHRARLEEGHGTYLGVSLLLGLSTLVACWIPARKASLTNLVETLKAE